MRPERFDDLTRRVGKGMSRRRVVKLLAVGSVGGVVAWNTLPSEAAEGGCGVQTMWVWANAFIPGHIPWLTQVVPAGPYAGRTAIPGPWPGADCFLTDQRSWDSGQGSDIGSHPSSRVAAVAQIDVVNSTILQQYLFSSGTVEVDCEDGAVECSSVAQIDGAGFHDAQPGSVKLRCWGHDPCVGEPPGLPLVPDIDMDLRFGFQRTARGAVDVTVEGAVEVFPAFEIYVRADGSGDSKTIFQHFPDEGRNPGDLGKPWLSLGVPVFVTAQLTNSTTCSVFDSCCPPGTGGTNECCPTGDTCCTQAQGGDCCPRDVAPVCCGGEGCCPTTYTCCNNSACCEPAFAQCCPGNRCCPPGTQCCGLRCCPAGWRCTLGGCRPQSGVASPADDIEITVARAAVPAHKRKAGSKRR